MGEITVSLVVLPGRVTALTGPDRAGASALLTVALGLVKPEQGRVTVGGVELDDLEPSAWWTKVAWVPERPALVAGTIAENIRLGWSATDVEVAGAAVAAGFDDLDGVLLDDEVSTADRQRIGLARAFLRNAEVVLLDEPAAALDEDSEGALASLRRLIAGRTVLMTAHRPDLVALADDIVPVLVPV